MEDPVYQERLKASHLQTAHCKLMDDEDKADAVRIPLGRSGVAAYDRPSHLPSDCSSLCADLETPTYEFRSKTNAISTLAVRRRHLKLTLF